MDMVAKCIWNDGRDTELTVGKEYELSIASELMVDVQSDKGKRIRTLKNRFELKKGAGMNE